MKQSSLCWIAVAGKVRCIASPQLSINIRRQEERSPPQRVTTVPQQSSLFRFQQSVIGKVQEKSLLLQDISLVFVTLACLTNLTRKRDGVCLQNEGQLICGDCLGALTRRARSPLHILVDHRNLPG
jgi:hypothetical protein